MEGRYRTITQLAGSALADPANERVLQSEIAAARQDIVRMGPREAFELNGVRYEADPSRAAALNPTQMAERLRALEDTATVETTMAAFRAGPQTRAWILDFERRASENRAMRPDLLRSLTARMTQESNIARGELRAEVVNQYEEDLASLSRTGRGSGPGGVLRATAERIRQAFADNPTEAAQRIERLRLARDAYQIDQRLQGSTPAEREAMRSDARASVAPQGGPDAFEAALRQRESSGNAGARNSQGYAGLYQFGTARLADLGLYAPASEDETPNTWSGRFTIPGHAGVRTLQDFLASPEAQRAAFDRHIADIDRQLGPLMEQYQGQTVGGVTITANGVRAMAHLGGVEGARRFLESGGSRNPADSNGTRLSDYARTFAAVDGGGAPYGAQARAEYAQHVDQRIQAYETRLNQHGSDMSLGQPQIAAAFADWQQLAAAGDPNAARALESAMAMSMEWQRASGIAPERIAPLPSTVAASIVQRYAGASTARERMAVLQSIVEVPSPEMRARVIAQLAGQGPTDNQIPRDLDLIMDLAADPHRRQTAENILSAMAVPRRDVQSWATGDRATAESRLAETFDGGEGTFWGSAGIGRVLAQQQVVTGNAAYSQQRDRLRDAVLHVARVRSAAGEISGGIDRALADMFGHYATMSNGLAQIFYRADGVDRDRLTLGLRVLREREANRLAFERPGDDAGRLAQEQFDAMVRSLRSDGVWVNSGGAFALILPGSGAALARYTMDAIMGVSRDTGGVPAEPEEPL